MVANGTQWHKMVLNGIDCYRMLPKVDEWYKMVTNGTKLRLFLLFCPLLSEFMHLEVPRTCLKPSCYNLITIGILCDSKEV